MSDGPQGHGWWHASDGKWYPPEQHPQYRPPLPPPTAPPGMVAGVAHADFGSRLGAYLIDVLLYGLITLIPVLVGVLLLISEFTDCVTVVGSDELLCPPGTPSVGIVILAIAILSLSWLPGAIHYVRSLARTGQTWGRRATNIKVVRRDTGAVPGLGAALGRSLFAYVFSGSFLWLGYLWMLWDDNQQTWHDKVAGTIVIRTR